MGSKKLSLVGVVVALAFFVSVNLFAGTALRFWRADLTEHDLYTLSDGTRAILSKIDEPITARFFHSKKQTADVAVLDTYARRVRELLEEFEDAADGKLVVQVIDPEPYSEAEELAISFGIRGQLAGPTGEVLYLGLAFTNSVDDLETIEMLDPREESRIEYEMAKIVHELSRGAKPKVAVLSSLPLDGGPPNPFGGPPPQSWRLLEVLRELYDVEVLDPNELKTAIDPATDVLVIAHPKGLPPPAQFAIDQYAVGGGKVLAFVDPYCFFDMPPPQAQQQFGYPRTSELDTLLGAWGVELVAGRIAGDRDLGRSVRSGNSIVPFPLWIELNATADEGCFDQDDFVTADLSLVGLFCPGELKKVEDAKPTVTPILFTSATGRTIDAVNLQYAPNPIAMAPNLASQFQLGGSFERLPLAMRVSGAVRSAFPEGAPEGWEGEGEPKAEGEGFNAIVVADADLLAEELWTTVQRTQFGDIQAMNDNPNLVLNAIDHLCGSNDLLSLRSRGVFRRPFQKKEELDREARDRWLAKDEELQSKERELADEIRDLQKGADEQGRIIMTAQQFEEIQEKQREEVDIKRERREVRHQLSKDIENLGFRLKVLNMGLVPGLVVLGGLVFHLGRRSLRR